MYSSDRKVMPPLWIWWLLILIILIGAALLFKLSVVKKEKDFTYRSSYLQRGFKQAGQQPVILFLGTSATRYAIDSCRTIEAELKCMTDKKPVVLKMWRNATTLETMIREMPVLNKLHPAFLIVEANMLCYSFESTFSISQVSEMLPDVVGGHFIKPYFPDEKPFKPQNPDTLREREHIVNTLLLRSFKNLATQLQKNGTRIIIVNIPLEASEEIKKWKSADTLQFKQNLEYIRKDIPFEYWDMKTTWDMPYYYDRGHMNPRGCAAFSKWLCNKLSSKVQQP